MAQAMLVREYKGKKFVVVAQNGRFWVGKGKEPDIKRAKPLRSLSGAATAITHHPTSGQGFFGFTHYKTA